MTERFRPASRKFAIGAAQDGRQQFVEVWVDPELMRKWEQYEVKYGAAVESTWQRDLLF